MPTITVAYISSFVIAICATQNVSQNDLSKVFDTTRTGLFQDVLQPSCECVNRQLCKDGVMNKHGFGIIDIRSSVCEHYLQLCCTIENKLTIPTLPDIPLPSEDHGTGCGYRNADGVGYKITGAIDDETEFGEFPWMVALLRDQGGHIELQQCGGSIIAPTVILTAAHCVKARRANELVVRAGEWDMRTTNEILPHQERRVKEIVAHEYYNKGALYNDIALLILESPLEWAAHIRPVCLPAANASFDNMSCLATGWGKEKLVTTAYQTILKKVELPIVPAGRCQENLRSVRAGFNLHESFICAGGEEGVDTCKGDGGSPLVCPIPGESGRFYQAGIVSWGIGCGTKDVPGLYAGVAYLRQWINTQLNLRSIESKYFTK